MAKDVRVKITADSQGLKKGIDAGTKSLKGFDKQAGLTTSTLVKMGGGVLSFTAILSQAKKGFTDLASETHGLSKVNAVLAATGGVAGITAKQIESISLGMQMTTTTSQDAAREVASLGLSFTNINKDIFPEYMSLSADMAAITGGDMSGAALQLGKALQDPILGATALSRAGINLTQQQRDQIKVFQKSGQTMKAQEVILKELRKEFAGAATAVGSDFFGTVTRAFNAIDDFRKEFLKGFGMGAFDGVKKLFEYIIDNQVSIGKNFRRLAYDFTHNFVFESIKSMGILLKYSYDGWTQIGDLWEDFFGDSFFTTVSKGWKMLFIVVQSGWQMIVETVTNGIINPIEKTFNKIKAIGTFLTGGSYSDAIGAANAQNAAIDARGDNGFSKNINSIFEKMNEDIFNVNTGQDVRQQEANFKFDKSTFDLTSGTTKGGFPGLLDVSTDIGTSSESPPKENEWRNRQYGSW